MKGRRLLARLLIVMVFASLMAIEASAAPKGKYKLPTKIISYSMQNGKWVKSSTDTIKFNSKGDVVKSSKYGGKAKTTYWKGTRKKKKVVWTGRGYGSKDILYYNKKGRLTKHYDDVGTLDYGDTTYTYKYSKGWISQEKSSYEGGWAAPNWYMSPSKTTRNFKRTFHSNGVIKSFSYYGRSKVYYNKKGLVTKFVEKDGQYPFTATVKYKYDKKGNVTTARITYKYDYGDIYKSKIVYKYGKTAKVNRRTQSAWVCEFLGLVHYPNNAIYKDVLGVGL